MNYKNCMGMVHYVKNGETMYNLSRMYGVTIDELIESNPMVNVYNMQEGDEICIPFNSLKNNVETNNSSRYNNREDFYEMVKRFDK